MRRVSGNVYESRGKWYARIRLSPAQRPTVALPTCSTREQADARLKVLADLANRLREVGQLELAPRILEKAGAAAEGAALGAVVEMVARLCSGRYAPEKGDAKTFGELAEDWTSGKLHREHPDHVKKKSSADTDEHRLTHVLPLLEDIPLVDFTLDHAERVMRALPPALSPSSRRQVAQVMHRVLALAVFPCRIIAANPLPRGWLPKLGPAKAKTYLYPDEDAQLMACKAVPLCYRVLYGFLHREGMRRGEAFALRWGDLDLERGAVTLDENKTDDPRAWALDPGVAAALCGWRDMRPDDEEEDHVFVDEAGRALTDLHLAGRYRAHLQAAGVDREQLYATTAARRRIRLHDTRATFVTIALANGRSEAWVADRTGHRSSQQINGYRRAARSVAELGLGDLESLSLAIPELAGGEDEGATSVGSERAAQRAAGCRRSWRNWQTRWIQVSRSAVSGAQRAVSGRKDDGSSRLGRGAALSEPPAALCAGTNADACTEAPGGLVASLTEAIRRASAEGRLGVAQELARTLAGLLGGGGGDPGDVVELAQERAKRDRERR